MLPTPRPLETVVSSRERFSADRLRSLFDEPRPLLFGLEEEVIAVDPGTLEPLPSAPALLAGLGDDPAFKLELPASQIEIVTRPGASVDELVAELTEARRRLAAALDGTAGLLAAGVHPSAPAESALNEDPRHARVAHEYGLIARRQLVCGLHVHVGMGGAERVLAVYNALRAYLPLLAALGANAPLHEARDTGLASIRPLIAGMLPRQGIPPVIGSWNALAVELAWGGETGRLEGMHGWWWELRLHPVLGTIEIRVPDAQSLPGEAGALAAVAAALVVHLGDRHDAGDLEPPAASWRIAENRWSAARGGLEGQMFDLETGAVRATSELLDTLIGELAPVAARIGGAAQLADARTMLTAGNGASRQRRLHHAAGGDARAVTAELSAAFAGHDGRREET